MRNSQGLLLILFLFGVASSVHAQKTLSIVTEDGPPHMIQASNSGIDIDITREALRLIGYESTIEYAPLSRARLQVVNGDEDITVPTFFAADSDNFYISKPIIRYRPTVFSNQKFDFRSIEDIEGLSIRTFQGAKGYFGDSFVKMTQKNDYEETANMASLVRMLALGRVDVVVLDYYIFYYYLSQMEHEQKVDIEEYDLLPAVKASVGFNNMEIRDQFDNALETLENQNRIDDIIRRYIGR